MNPTSSDQVQGKGKTRWQWTAREDEKVVEALLEIFHSGKWKAENGFKPGYLAELENKIEWKASW